MVQRVRRPEAKRLLVPEMRVSELRVAEIVAETERRLQAVRWPLCGHLLSVMLVLPDVILKCPFSRDFLFAFFL